jgi:hypothetical protein
VCFFTYLPGNILLIHLNEKKKTAFPDKRRVFNRLTKFENYENGNVLCNILVRIPGGKVGCFSKSIEIPIYYTKFLASNTKSIPMKYLKLLPMCELTE